MPRICIAVLAILALFAPTASARILDEAPVVAKAEKAVLVQPERMTDTGGTPKVMPERITDHSVDAPKVMPERITDHSVDAPKVMPERITDHSVEAPTSSLAGTTDETAAALAQEAYYASQSDALAGLVREQESTTRAGNQGAPQPDVDGTPWAIMLVGISAAALLASGVTLMTRRTRTRVAA